MIEKKSADEIDLAQQAVELGATAIVNALEAASDNPVQHAKLVQSVEEKLRKADLAVGEITDERRGVRSGRTRTEVIMGRERIMPLGKRILRSIKKT